MNWQCSTVWTKTAPIKFHFIPFIFVKFEIGQLAKAWQVHFWNAIFWKSCQIIAHTAACGPEVCLGLPGSSRWMQLVLGSNGGRRTSGSFHQKAWFVLGRIAGRSQSRKTPKKLRIAMTALWWEANHMLSLSLWNFNSYPKTRFLANEDVGASLWWLNSPQRPKSGSIKEPHRHAFRLCNWPDTTKDPP